MKKLLSVLLATMMIVSLTACAGGMSGKKVTCPSCGHVFTTDKTP